MQNHFERKFLTRSGGLAVEVLVRLDMKRKVREVSARGFDPQIPGVAFAAQPGRDAALLVAADRETAYAWLRANAQELHEHVDYS